MIKYILLSTPRSGSNHLAHLLASHPNVMSYGEPFQPNFLLGNPTKTPFENYFIHILYQRYREKFPIFFIKNIIFRNYPSSIYAAGFKIFYDHAENKDLSIVWKYLKSIEDLRIIHLKRKNLLKSLVSFYIAKKTGEFISFQNSRAKSTIQLSITPEECLEYFHKIEHWRKKYELFFSDKKIHTIYYEDLIANQHQEVQNLELFLSIPATRLSSNLKRQNTRLLSDIITNYTSLQRYFYKTPWASFFDE